MGYLSFTEKDWDKVRPFAVKKTGVSEAINAFEKVVPNKLDDLESPAQCKTAADLLDVLSDKLDGALKQMDKKKHDEAIKTIGRWRGELTTRGKAITEHGAKLTMATTVRIEKASEVLDPFFKEMNALNAEILGIRSNLQECAKQAVLAVARGALDELPAIQDRAQGMVSGYGKLLPQVAAVPKIAEKSLAGKLPSGDDLTDAQKINRTKVNDRLTALQYAARDIAEMQEDFMDLLDSVMTAQKQAGSLEDKFVKIVASDAATCRGVMKPIAVGEASLSSDLKHLDEYFEQVQKAETSEEEKAKLTRGISMALKSSIEHLKTCRGQADELETLVKKKLADYPDFVKPDNEKFKRPLLDIAAVMKFNVEMKTKTFPALGVKIKKYVETFNTLPRN